METISLTPKGEIKAEEAKSNTPKGAILTYIYEDGNRPTEFDELADKLNIDDDKLLKILRSMVSEDLIKWVE